MPRGALLTGAAGGILGSITGITGVLWIIVNINFAVDIYNYSEMLGLFSQLYGLWALAMIPYPSSGFLFSTLTLLLAIFIIVSCILLGAGFYGTYQAGGGVMGVVGLIFGIIGGSAGGLFILLGNFITSAKLVPLFVVPIFEGFEGIIPYPVFTPNTPIIWLGLMVLTVSFILLGVSSIVVREITANSSASMAAGILSIIGACFLVLYVLMQFEFPPLAILAGILTLVGFILIFVAFVIWAVVFATSRDI